MLRQLSTILAASTLLVGIASAQSTTLPTCAQSCVTSLLPASCNLDPNCICHASSFLDNIGCCVFKACDTADQQSALAYAHSICDPVSASSLLPASATCTSSASSGSATSSSGTVTGAVATTVTGSAASRASSSAASVSSSISSVASSASASVSSVASSLSASISSAASSASASAASVASSATSTPTGAANQLAVGLGAVGAGMLGLAAML